MASIQEISLPKFCIHLSPHISTVHFKGIGYMKLFVEWNCFIFKRVVNSSNTKFPNYMKSTALNMNIKELIRLSKHWLSVHFRREILVMTTETTQRYVPESNTLHSYRRSNFKPHTVINISVSVLVNNISIAETGFVPLQYHDLTFLCSWNSFFQSIE